MIAALVFPHQLFKENEALQKASKVYLIEEWLYFKQFKFHKQKLILHRASMRFYAQWLQQNGYGVVYINSATDECDVRQVIPMLAQQGVTQLNYNDLADDWLQRRLHKACSENNITTKVHRTPQFLNSSQDVKAYFDKKKSYFQTDFYIDQRKQRKILVTQNNLPEGGKWSFDEENRLKFPKHEQVPKYSFPKENEFVKEARAYVSKYYSDHYGSDAPPFNTTNGFYPTTFNEAQQWLDDFLQQRFAKFGAYEDAIVKEENILYHSVLSPLLNTGLLTPQQVLDETLAAAVKYKIPMNSVEGFVRQLIGWREYIHIVYEREGRRQRTKNYWGFTRKIPESFWKAETGIEPVDNVIKHVLQNAYSHHIERLMIMGNFMLLCEFHPDDVYHWFMELYIDAYDWVMVPNTYGMTQFADGGIMMTKPYVSSSNYILKMSNYSKSKNAEWQQVWDGLFWRFMHVHRTFFETNPRIGMLLKTWDKMAPDKKKQHLKYAEDFLQNLDNSF